ncbi:MAG: hypothetical protein ABIS36_19740 [Chryseolinea sp.]
MKKSKSSDTTKGILQQQFDNSLAEVLEQLHIQSKSKKVQKLIEKTSKKLASRMAKELAKQAKAAAKAKRKGAKR